MPTIAKKQLRPPPPGAVLLSTEEAAFLLEVAPSTVLNLIKSGQIEPVVRGGPGRQVRRIRRSEVEQIKADWQRWQADTERLREREDAAVRELTGGAVLGGTK
ncbi:MAG TPA: helix-turn-helix domain-containing protein [Streptosporangiaceae bacterium]|nr:helix-turn-helix domain-containing protein [Streptosporangiaceae bacterium]